MRTRVWFMSLVLASLAMACGDQPTEVVPDREVDRGLTQMPGEMAAATSTSDDGLSITTDKDDYAPGDTVHFSGSGWPANDVLDIVLVDDAVTQETHTWTISVAEDGTFQDSTYVVNIDDIGVMFTLTATSRATGRSLIVQFTDGTIMNASIQMREGSTCTSAPSSVAVGTPICAFASFDISGNGATNVQFRWKNPSGTIVEISQKDPAFGNLGSGLHTGQSYSATYTPTVAGTWTVLLCQSNNTDPVPGGVAQCASGSQKASQTFTVTTGPTKLAFTSSAFTGVVGECLGAITVQTQNASNVATNVTSNTSVNLATDGTGAFYSNNTCTTGITSITIASGSNSGSFYYKATARGDGTHALTVSATGLTSTSQTQTINQAETSTTLTSSSNPSIVGELVTFEATVDVTSPGSGTPTGSVTFIDGGTCASPTTVLASTVALSSAKASFQTSALSVGGHTIVGCYSGDDDFKSSNGSITQNVRYTFDGLYAPVDRPNTMNVSKAGQSIPLKWRLTDYSGDPILNLTNVTVKVTGIACSLGTTIDQVEEYAPGASGLQNLGDGYYQFNWKTPTSYASSCKEISLVFVPGILGYSEERLAYFTFKK